MGRKKVLSSTVLGSFFFSLSLLNFVFLLVLVLDRLFLQWSPAGSQTHNPTVCTSRMLGLQIDTPCSASLCPVAGKRENLLAGSKMKSQVNLEEG